MLLVCSFLFVQTSTAQEATVLPALAEDENGADENDDTGDRKHRHPRLRQAAPRVTPDGTQLPEEGSSLALVSSSFDADELIIVGQAIEPIEFPALPDVEGTRINAGKKTSWVSPDQFPTIVNNNFRQVLATTPGLLFSEEPSSTIINIGYRGLDTQRSELSQVLMDGVSIKNEQFGFPETHYTPPLDAIDHIEFVRGGAALQYGPQPGGAINFVTRMPRTDTAFNFSTLNTFGSDGLFTDYTEVDGTSGPLGYYAYYNHRQRDGFREANSDFELNSGAIKLVYDPSKTSRFVFTFDGYEEDHGEPGGLTTVPGPGAALYSVDRDATTRFFDRFHLQRYYATLGYEHDISDMTLISLKAFGGFLSRYSHRQRGGGFGTIPTGPASTTDSIQNRDDWTEGAEMRIRHDYQLAGGTSTFSGGLYFYHALQNRTDERGTTPDATSGELRNYNTGVTYDGAIFAENRFVFFDRFSVVPGMRLENLHQSLNESVNVAKDASGDPLLSRSDFSFVPLFGLGLEYVAVPGVEKITPAVADGKSVAGKETPMIAPGPVGPPRVQFYGNVSQAYRPRTYGELVPTGPNSVVNGDLVEGKSLQFELGVRGKPFSFLNYDVSGFYYTFDKQVGDITTPGGFSTTGNVGDAHFAGVEAAVELDLLALANEGNPNPYGSLVLFSNATYLDAEFTSGPFTGRTPSYAPAYQIKAGLLYNWQNRFKAGLIGIAVDDSYADANNSFERFIPAYMTWDLTMEAKFFKGRLGVVAGINNLFNENYWGEVRDEGIVPAYLRNYYGGVKIEF